MEGFYIGKNYKLVKTNLIKHKRTGLFIRPDTIDGGMINGCLNNYKNVNFENNIILDLGANIGGFVYMSLQNNCKQIIAIEPDKYNFNLLKLNIHDQKAILLEGAIVNSNIKEIDFHFNQSKRNMCSGSIQKTSNKKKFYKVKAYNFHSILDQYKPSILKIDIEGYEYEILKEKLPNYINEIVIEFHLSNKNQRQQYHKIINLFDDWVILSKKENMMFKKLIGIDLHIKKE